MNGVMHRLKICTIVFAMNWGMDYWVSYSFYSPASPQTRSKFIKKHWSWVTASTSREQTAKSYNSFGALQSNRFSSSGECDYTQVLTVGPSFTKNKMCKEVNRFFSSPKYAITQCISMLYTEKICIALLCSVFTDPVTYTVPLTRNVALACK